MPTHNYQCKKCKEKYEVFYTSIGAVDREEPVEKCPSCKSKQKKRLFSPCTSFVLKGKGWYRDGYK